MSKATDGYDIILHAAQDAPDDVWGVMKPSVRKFIYQDGAPYGRSYALTYTWEDPRVGLELKIEVWRDSAGIHARRVST